MHTISSMITWKKEWFPWYQVQYEHTFMGELSLKSYKTKQEDGKKMQTDGKVSRIMQIIRF